MAATDPTNFTREQIEALGGVISGNVGKAKVLTTADYNWPTENPASIAMWLLPDGLYANPNGLTIKTSNSSELFSTDKTFIVGSYSNGRYYLLFTNANAGANKYTIVYGSTSQVYSDTWYVLTKTNVVDNLTSTSTGAPLSANQGKALKDLIDGLVTSGAGAPTTATVGTVGTLYEDTTNGKLYQCTAVSGNTYTWTEVGAGGGSGGGIIELTSADYNYPTDNPTSVALWKLEAGLYTKGTGVTTRSSTSSQAGSAGNIFLVGEADSNNTVGITIFGKSSQTQYSTNKTSGALVTDGKNVLYNNMIEQSAGTATTTVMSQNAVTSMVYADPATRYKVRITNDQSAIENNAIAIGRSATNVWENSIGIGYSASASSKEGVALGHSARISNALGGIALGAYSRANSQGEMNIGSTNTSYGYNSSNYRLLSGLYDPQSAHDAANKEYVDPTTDSSAPTTATVGRLGQIQIDTTTATAYMCVEADDVTPSYTWKQITA